jgi:redox-sensing transcriptional repressor
MPDLQIETQPHAGNSGQLMAQDDVIDIQIPEVVVRRLPLYVRTLRELNTRGISCVSSEVLASAIGMTAAQIRRDLAYFGKFGKQGRGYETGFLADQIASFLKLDREWSVALVGHGNLGKAITHYRGLIPSSFRIEAIFDRNLDEIGVQFGELKILSETEIENEIARLGIRIGIIAVPAHAAQLVADRMVVAGVMAILNYAPVLIRVPEDVVVREIDPIASLQSMTFYLPD